MDVSQLFQLAKDNSRIAEKKFERESAKRGGIDSFSVSKDNIAKFLAKQKREKEEKLAAENLARQQRIKARVEANTNKKKLKEQQRQKEHIEKLKAKNKEIENIKFKVHESHKAAKNNNNNDRVNSKSTVPSKHSSSNIDNKVKIHKEKDILKSKSESKHRKEEARTKINNNDSVKQKSHPNGSLTNRPEKLQSLNKKPSVPSKKPQQNNPASSVNFMELMKMAKTNSIKALNCSDPHNMNLKRNLPKEKDTKESFDPDRFVKTKVAKKEKHAHVADTSKSISRHNIDITKSLPSKPKSFEKQNKQNKDISREAKPRPKCTFTVETISTKSNADNMHKISKMYKQTKPMSTPSSSSSSSNRGISAQNQAIPKKNIQGKSTKLKKSVRDVEDEFEREERELLRKRKLFEMRRVTGNRNLTEDDLFIDNYDDDDDYDEDDDDFIDDSEDTVNASKYIREIFGYDRRRYNDSDDDDLANMEASYSQIQKEELRSARIAKIEDDYEKMKEEEELKRKKKRR